MLPLEITPKELNEKLDNGVRVVLVDVREPVENQICRIEGSHLIPMRTVAAEVQKLEAAADEALVVVYCHHGVRSLSVVNWLREHGVSECQSLNGGIDRWSVEIDPSVPRY